MCILEIQIPTQLMKQNRFIMTQMMQFICDDIIYNWQDGGQTVIVYSKDGTGLFPNIGDDGHN